MINNWFYIFIVLDDRLETVLIRLNYLMTIIFVTTLSLASGVVANTR